MRRAITRKLLSAILTSFFVFGIMVVIVDEGPLEMPYYDDSWEEPVTSPELGAVYYEDETGEPRISTLPQTNIPNDAMNGQEYNGTSNYAQ